MAQPFDPQPPLQNSTVSPSRLSNGGAPPPESASENAARRIFLGPNGLRAGWRLLIFAAIVFVLLAIFGTIQQAISHRKTLPFSAEGILTGDGAIFLIFLLASWIMARIEGRRIADYGLPARKTFGKQFWQGAAIGFIALTILLAALRGLGDFYFGSLAIHGGVLAKDAALWALAWVAVGFAEEYSLRGYPLFTLTTGIGFWPAAILVSIAFGSLHLSNGGEDWLGALSAGSFGFLFCLILRRTGDLWMPIGFHAAWDWGESFFYGVPNSGQVTRGHMLNSSFHGAKLLTGGSVGPEGSILCFVVLVLCWVFFHFWLPQSKYPNPAALGSHPHLESHSSAV